MNWSSLNGVGIITVSGQAGAQCQNITVIGNTTRQLTVTTTNGDHMVFNSVVNLNCSNNICDGSADAHGTGAIGGIYFQDTVAASTGVVSGNSITGVQVNITISSALALTSYTAMQWINNVGFNPWGFRGAVVTPAFPATGVYVTNTQPFPVNVRLLTAGTMTAYFIKDTAGNVQTFTVVPVVGQTFYLAPGVGIAFTLAAAGTWIWEGL